MVLALGALLDLDLPAHSPEAMQWYQIARAALSLDSVLEVQTIPGIQALQLSLEDRDSGKWKLDPEETQKRRELFYEILTYDSWQSLTFGRPPSLAAVHIDCKLPHETNTTLTGEVEMSFAAWKHKFSAECLSVVHDQAFGTRFPSYSVIQELDKKVRNWYVPPSLMVPGFGNSKIGMEVEQPSVELTMQRYISFAIKEITLFYMHRGFFAQALEDSSGDPTGSKYSQSVLAAYNSAMSLVALTESLFKQHPQLTERMWFLFTHVFSSAIILGSIAAKPRLHFAGTALSYLDLACHLFSQVSDTARTGKILPILQKMKERAHAVQASAPNVPVDSTGRHSFLSPSIKTEEGEITTELSALGGLTRLVARRNTPSSPSYSASSPSSPDLNPPSPPTRHSSSIGSTYSQMNDNPNAWQNYTHIQNLNVNINVGDYPTYSPASTSTTQHSDMNYGYPSTSHTPVAQPQHQQPQQQQQHMPMMDNGLGEYYNYNNFNMPMVQTQEVNPPINDMDYPWHNLVAQYR
ncbi:hypothetical protein H1R20_g13194, partial [Candolleomyces eurysporus]